MDVRRKPWERREDEQNEQNLFGQRKSTFVPPKPNIGGSFDKGQLRRNPPVYGFNSQNSGVDTVSDPTEPPVAEPNSSPADTGYDGDWQKKLDEIINQILNREKFSYDINGDALFQMYQDMYNQGGQRAMMDTMGQAQAMTGGYGNSYAQTVGQQAYQGYMQDLNGMIPELYQLALSKYDRDTEDLYDQYSLLRDIEEREKSKGSGGSGGGEDNPRKPEGDPGETKPVTESDPDYHSIANRVKQMYDQNFPVNKIKSYLNQMVRLGYITEKDAQSILDGYVPVDFKP